MGNVCAVRVCRELGYAVMIGLENKPETKREVELPHEPVTFMAREGSVGDSNTISVEIKPKLLVHPEVAPAGIFQCKFCGCLYAEE